MARLCFDYGHGGEDSGACYNGRKESNDVLSIGRAVVAELRRHGIIVDETRTSDSTVSLNDRSAFENINTLNAESELVLSVLSSIAQEELSSLSQNIRWGNQKRYQKGIVQVNTKRFLGYDVSEEGKLIINEAEAVIVRRIFKDYIGGKGTGIIARELERDGIKTVTGKARWSGSAVRNMLANEKYCGDAILQKTIEELEKEREAVYEDNNTGNAN